MLLTELGVTTAGIKVVNLAFRKGETVRVPIRIGNDTDGYTDLANYLFAAELRSSTDSLLETFTVEKVTKTLKDKVTGNDTSGEYQVDFYIAATDSAAVATATDHKWDIKYQVAANEDTQYLISGTVIAEDESTEVVPA